MNALVLMVALTQLDATVPADAGVEAPAVVADAPNALQVDPEKVGFLQGKLEALEEQYVETKNDVLSFKKLKVSGYLQARYTYLDAAVPESRFTVRRARLKTEYLGSMSKFAVELDGNSTGISLKVAEASFIEPWSGKELITVTAGQMKYPFGYETMQSSGERELPELSRVVGAFNNGEYDRGAKVALKYEFVRAVVGVYDGNGTAQTGFLGKDNDTEKDVVGRAGVDFKWLTAGVSGWVGRTFKPGDKYYERSRFALDAQVYLDLFPFGGTAIKGELLTGRTYQVSGVDKYGQTAAGWYVLLVQNIFKNDQVAVRYDFFDPWTGVPNGGDENGVPLTSNQMHTVGIQAAHWFGDVVKVSATYEIPLLATIGGTPSPRQNLFTLQFLGKF